MQVYLWQHPAYSFVAIILHCSVYEIWMEKRNIDWQKENDGYCNKVFQFFFKHHKHFLICYYFFSKPDTLKLKSAEKPTSFEIHYTKCTTIHHLWFLCKNALQILTQETRNQSSSFIPSYNLPLWQTSYSGTNSSRISTTNLATDAVL